MFERAILKLNKNRTNKKKITKKNIKPNIKIE